MFLGYMSKKKKVAIVTLTVLAVIIAAALIVELFFLPRYLIGDECVLPSEVVSDTHRVMSYNIRGFKPLDLFCRSWYYRAQLIAEELAAVGPDIIGFQEVTSNQQSYLEDIMQTYAAVTAYADDTTLAEGCPIFYRTDKYELVASGGFWLSETPDKMSKSWNSEYCRIAVYAHLRDRVSGEELAVFNTQLDSESVDARINGVKVILAKMAELGDIPVLLLGDMSDEPNTVTLGTAYESFADTALSAHEAECGATYHAWGKEPERERTDYILVTIGDTEVYEYRTLDNRHGSLYSSDHAPIYAEFKLK